MTPPDRAPEGAGAPLARQLASEAARQRAEFARRGFDAAGYETLVQLAARLETDLARHDVSPEAIEHVRDRRRLFEDVRRLLSQPDAQAIPPTNDEIYTAAVELSRLAPVAERLAAPSARWAARLGAVLTADDDHARGRALLALHFAALCRSGGLKVDPGDSPIDLELDLGGWRVGVVTRIPDGPADVAPAASHAADALAEAGRPGIVLLGIGRALPPNPRLDRVADDHAAATEMQAHADRFLVDHQQAVAESAGTSHAFALVGAATLRTRNVASGRIAFATVYRAINLCPMDDARIPALRRFMDAFSRARV